MSPGRFFRMKMDMETIEKNVRKMTLLSPAGSRESLIAAVQNGADAVYLGGSAFNARRFADNFDDSALRWAFDYCHARGVAVHVTFNTLLFDKELDAALSYGRFLYEAGADAAIVQDFGLVRMLRENLPQLVLHASTQMGICSLEGVQIAEKMGLSRVVLAREMPLEAVRGVCAGTALEVETFAHGAMCMSTSGACLFSSMAGERSGNRGTCAQPCRKRMALGHRPAKNDYALSLSDLCMLAHVQDLADAGVCCIKLEGRMKRPEYVAAATHAYRAALDGAEWKELSRLQQDLFAVFNRGGERTGYYYGDDGITDCIAKAEPAEPLLQRLQETYKEDVRKLPVSLSAELIPGAPARLRMTAENASVEVCGELVQQAEKTQDTDRYAAQLRKLGGTPFRATELVLNMPAEAFLPVGQVNALRRAACIALNARLCAAKEGPKELHMPPVPPARDLGRGEILARVRTAEQAKAAFAAGADGVLLAPIEYEDQSLPQKLQAYRNAGKRLLLSLPASILSRSEHARIARLVESGLFDGAEANNLGQLPLIMPLSARIAGSGLNALNAQCVAQLYALGFTSVVLSQELTKPQMRDILIKAGGIVMVYGRTEMMQLRHCPVRERHGCKNCAGNAGTLVDESGRVFPLSNVRQAGGCLIRVLNCTPTDVIDLCKTLPPVEAMFLAFYDELPNEVALRVENACRAREGKPVAPAEGATRGHWARAVE